MREMKFRCWDSDNNRWMDEEGNAIRAVFTLENKTYLKWTQWTGLKDKNGVEIYEGDVISAYGTRDKVYWGGIGWEPFEGSMLDAHDSVGYEIIGNIYENPELVDK